MGFEEKSSHLINKARLWRSKMWNLENMKTLLQNQQKQKQVCFSISLGITENKEITQKLYPRKATQTPYKLWSSPKFDSE